MTTIPHLNTDCQDEIPFYTEAEITRTGSAEPIATPLAGFLEASKRKEEAAQVASLVLAIHGDIFFADRVIVAILSGKADKLDIIEAAIPEWECEPEMAYFEDEVTT